MSLPKRTVATRPSTVKLKRWTTTRDLTCHLVPFTERQWAEMVRAASLCPAPYDPDIRPHEYIIELNWHGLVDLVRCKSCRGILLFPYEYRPEGMFVARGGVCARARAVRRKQGVIRYGERDPRKPRKLIYHTLAQIADEDGRLS
jgi:hypothetical protein